MSARHDTELAARLLHDGLRGVSLDEDGVLRRDGGSA